MALSKEIYQVLEDIVGPENISEEPAILDSYAYQFGAELITRSSFLPRPEVAILPGSTEEVQAIVKTCNQYKIKYKAHSTGWFFKAGPYTKGVVQLDMRRMNRILEIDEQNMYAIVEPYVIASQLQAEAMKVGLNCNMIGAGGSCSPLAQSCVGLPGHGASSIYMGHASEVLLAMEWVLPTGDVLNTGSLGSGIGWFCGEGPGPSLRGIARGRLGPGGDLGVFTKCAIKLSHWPGPPELPVEGTVPAYKSPLPDNFRAYTIALPSWQALADTYYKIWDNEIGYMAHRQFAMWGTDLQAAMINLYNDPTKSLDYLEEILKKSEIQNLTEEMRISFDIVLAGNSQNDIGYQEKVLDKILAETGGWKVAAMAEPAMQRWLLLYYIRHGHKSTNFIYGGTFGAVFTQLGSPDGMIQGIPVLEKTIKKYQDKGLLVQCGTDTMMGCVGAMGGGTYCLVEQFCHYDPYDKESVEGGIGFLKDAIQAYHDHGWRCGHEEARFGGESTKEQREATYAAAPQPIRFNWQWQIKQMLDPNDTGGPLYNTMEKLPNR